MRLINSPRGISKRQFEVKNFGSPLPSFVGFAFCERTNSTPTKGLHPMSDRDDFQTSNDPPMSETHDVPSLTSTPEPPPQPSMASVLRLVGSKTPSTAKDDGPKADKSSPTDSKVGADDRPTVDVKKS